MNAILGFLIVVAVAQVLLTGKLNLVLVVLVGLTCSSGRCVGGPRAATRSSAGIGMAARIAA